jgi:hypothetical protein
MEYRLQDHGIVQVGTLDLELSDGPDGPVAAVCVQQAREH